MRQAFHSDVFDTESLLGRLMHDEELVRTVLAAFLQDFPDQLRALDQQLSERDLETARRQIHTMRGTSATVAATALHSIARQIEQTVHVEDWAECIRLLDPANRAFQEFRNAVIESGWN